MVGNIDKKIDDAFEKGGMIWEGRAYAEQETPPACSEEPNDVDPCWIPHVEGIARYQNLGRGMFPVLEGPDGKQYNTEGFRLGRQRALDKEVKGENGLEISLDSCAQACDAVPMR